MLKLANVLDEETKVCAVASGDDIEFYRSIGMTEMDVEFGYDNQWYVKGYAPQKPVKQKAQEKIDELRAQLASTDYIDNKFLEAIVMENSNLLETLKIKYKDKLVERQSIRDQIDELEEIING